MMGNSTASLTRSLVPTTLHFPLYHVHRDSIVPYVSDSMMSVAVPVATYWIISLFFTLLDYLQLPCIEKYRIHEAEEITKRNKVTPRQVVKAVLFQQAIQTALGMFYLEDVPTASAAAISVSSSSGHSLYNSNITRVQNVFPQQHHRTGLLEAAGWVVWLTNTVLAPKHARWMLVRYGTQLTEWTYWWGIPLVQLIFACFVMDTWQYFWHRFFHTNSFLYRHVHSVHHRLYVPYAFGALYNHPLEGFILDSLGAVVSHWASGMSTRQAILLFGMSTAKTVDDHCGLSLPWDPFQIICKNNSDYHDIHHQQFGIKKNFSQPYFVHWDVLLSTRMTRAEAQQRQRLSSHNTTFQQHLANGDGDKLKGLNRINGNRPKVE